jgi:DNA-binding transcriptional LysR family regulator
VVAEVSHLTVIPGVVAQTNLIATMPKRLAELYAEMMDLQVLQNPVYEDAVIVYQMWHDRFEHDEGHKWFRNLTRQITMRRSPGIGSDAEI